MAGCSHSTIALFVCRCINIYSRMASRNLTSVHSAPSLALIKVTSARICLCTAKRKIGCATSEYPSLQAFLFQGVDASDYGLAVTVNTCIVWLRTSGSVCCIFGEGNFQLRFVASPSKISSASQVFGMLFFFFKKEPFRSANMFLREWSPNISSLHSSMRNRPSQNLYRLIT